MIAAGDPNVSRRGAADDRALGLPDLRLVLGHVHRQLHELPDRGARPGAAGQRHACWPRTPTAGSCSSRPAARIVDTGASATYEQDDDRVLPRSIATFEAFENAMTLDIAMGGSTNTVLHLLAAAQEGGVDFTMADIDRLIAARAEPVQGRAVRARRPHRGRAPRRRHHGASWASWTAPACSHRDVPTVHARRWATRSTSWDIRASRPTEDVADAFFRAAPGGVRTTEAFTQDKRFDELDLDRGKGCIRDAEHAFSKDGGLAVLYGNIAAGRLHREDRRRRREHPGSSPARRASSRARTRRSTRSWPTRSRPATWCVIRYEGPKGGPGMQEMLYPTTYLKSKGLGKACALVTDGRFSGGTVGLSHRPRLARGGGGRHDRPGRRGRPDRDRHPGPHDRRRRSPTPSWPSAARAMEAKGEAAWQPATRSASSRRRCRPTPR